MSFPIIHRGGEPRVLANLPRTATLGAHKGFPLYESQFALLSRDQWKPMTTDEQIKAYVDAIPFASLDQNGLGACGAYSCAIALSHARLRAGMPYIKPAPGRLYHYSGGGRDNGSQLSDNLKYAMQYGIPPFTSRSAELDYRDSWTDAEMTAAKPLRIVGGVDCPSFERLVSALHGPCDAVEHGILCGKDYDVDDSGLWIKPPKGNDGGHAQCSPGMLFVPSLNDAFCALCLRDGVYGLLIQGSWGSTQFGYKGWYVLPEGYFKNSPFTDGWGVYSTVIDAPK